MAKMIGQHLGLSLLSRIDVLGIDCAQLLKVAPASVMQKLEELEQQAALEDSGMLEQASPRRGPDREIWKAEICLETKASHLTRLAAPAPLDPGWSLQSHRPSLGQPLTGRCAYSNRSRREGPYLKSATRTEPSRESTLAVTSRP
jgi:hypothetical protein